MAPLEPWEKVLVDADKFLETIHGQIACVDCHAGNATAETKEAAHEELVIRPSEQPDAVCRECHPDVFSEFGESLHASQRGYWEQLEARGFPVDSPVGEEMFANHCESCHTSCGDCHISQPGAVGGGLLDGHVFVETPSVTRNCTACHGSRVGNEYLGKNEEIKADVHFRQGRMSCADCHSSQDMHGLAPNCDSCHEAPEGAEFVPPEHRYDGLQTPKCESCHAAVTTGQDGIQMHVQHGAALSCQVCHSEVYTSCDGCHVQVSAETGSPYYTLDDHYMTFMIGRNTIRSFDRPYEYVTVRHVPIAEDSYAYYGENLLPNFDAAPTWVYTTPHNIQRITPQNRSCEACHGNPDLFLTADKVAPNEFTANEAVIVDLGAIPNLGGEP